ncbi:MAG TPA: glycerol-3-phosphate responsive antiterminator [Mesotoga sp.]|jgi:glycerol uptake operon antiterminator|nr:glycerol-3-phosphate responsive antiterminator [Mesotoga sp.]MDI9376375.1 glycerol-3-phosphate responsive antiterminator [Thermotogota bacterium]NLX34484.1 glycerol-3-phosphate responsive antiterminator [Thermotogaceae bacterium]MDD4039657.1 glycerol-3-phosphate responsive antiterminator [Mesotoga sp.]MDD4477661.1 glycerol-3-phosphate responsive antiterminator [Mesotoga sp.]
MLKGIIAALWDRKTRPEEVDPRTVFFLNGGLFEIQDRINEFKAAGKSVFVDIDFISGLSGDEDSVLFLKKCGIDGIITAKIRISKQAISLGMNSLLRFFALDSRAVDKGIQQILSNGVKNIEILPGLVSTKVAPRIRAMVPDVNLVAAGLIDTSEELDLLKKYVDGVSTSSTVLWRYKW